MNIVTHDTAPCSAQPVYGAACVQKRYIIFMACAYGAENLLKCQGVCLQLCRSSRSPKATAWIEAYRVASVRKSAMQRRVRINCEVKWMSLRAQNQNNHVVTTTSWLRYRLVVPELRACRTGSHGRSGLTAKDFSWLSFCSCLATWPSQMHIQSIVRSMRATDASNCTDDCLATSAFAMSFWRSSWGVWSEEPSSFSTRHINSSPSSIWAQLNFRLCSESDSERAWANSFPKHSAQMQVPILFVSKHRSKPWKPLGFRPECCFLSDGFQSFARMRL